MTRTLKYRHDELSDWVWPMPLPGNAKLLGDAIPAESYATGRNPVPGWEERSHGNENQDMILFRESSCSGSWTHGFIKDMSYFYVQQLFLDVVRRMKE